LITQSIPTTFRYFFGLISSPSSSRYIRLLLSFKLIFSPWKLFLPWMQLTAG
jgi:hypothetical protein